MSGLQYKKLMAILDTTKDARHPLRAEIRGGRGDLILAIVREDGAQPATMATAPFDPMAPDYAANDVARQMTLDGGLPPGMDEQGT